MINMGVLKILKLFWDIRETQMLTIRPNYLRKLKIIYSLISMECFYVHKKI